MPIKTLFIIWSLERGGAERFLAGLLEHLDRNKFDPTLCCLNWKGEWAAPLEAKGLKVIALEKKGGLDLDAFRRLKNIIKEGEYHIVNTHLWAADVMGRVAAFQCGIPVVVSTAQNVDVWKKWHHRAVDRWLAGRTDQLIAVSAAVKEYYHHCVGFPEEKITVIPNAIDVERYRDPGDIGYLYEELEVGAEDFILACVGRLNHQKGHPYLFQAMKELSGTLPELRILIVGEGEDRTRLEAMANELGIMPMLRFTGQRADIPALLQLVDALILPSVFEGLPLCVLEAMAAARPVIATDVGGTAELAVDGETAFIVPPRRPEALKDAILRLRRLPDGGQSMGARGREVVGREFSIQNSTKKTEKLFTALLKGKL